MSSALSLLRVRAVIAYGVSSANRRLATDEPMYPVIPARQAQMSIQAMMHGRRRMGCVTYRRRRWMESTLLLRVAFGIYSRMAS
jgi:hypothetical protein